MPVPIDAMALGRSAILMEINPAYAAMARDRIHADLPMFAPAIINTAEECIA